MNTGSDANDTSMFSNVSTAGSSIDFTEIKELNDDVKLSAFRQKGGIEPTKKDTSKSRKHHLEEVSREAKQAKYFEPQQVTSSKCFPASPFLSQFESVACTINTGSSRYQSRVESIGDDTAAFLVDHYVADCPSRKLLGIPLDATDIEVNYAAKNVLDKWAKPIIHEMRAASFRKCHIVKSDWRYEMLCMVYQSCKGKGNPHEEYREPVDHEFTTLFDWIRGLYLFKYTHHYSDQQLQELVKNVVSKFDTFQRYDHPAYEVSGLLYMMGPGALLFDQDGTYKWPGIMKQLRSIRKEEKTVEEAFSVQFIEKAFQKLEEDPHKFPELRLVQICQIVLDHLAESTKGFTTQESFLLWKSFFSYSQFVMNAIFESKGSKMEYTECGDTGWFVGLGPLDSRWDEIIGFLRDTLEESRPFILDSIRKELGRITNQKN